MIGKRLKELRDEKNLLQKDIAKYLNISTSAYGYYEQGKRNPDTETVKNLADFFGVSADYLLGRTNNRKGYVDSKDSSHHSQCIAYKETEEKIVERLIDEGIITDDEPIPEVVFEKILKYGMEATVEILKLEKKLDE